MLPGCNPPGQVYVGFRFWAPHIAQGFPDSFIVDAARHGIPEDDANLMLFGTWAGATAIRDSLLNRDPPGRTAKKACHCSAAAYARAAALQSEADLPPPLFIPLYRHARKGVTSDINPVLGDIEPSMLKVGPLISPIFSCLLIRSHPFLAGGSTRRDRVPRWGVPGAHSPVGSGPDGASRRCVANDPSP